MLSNYDRQLYMNLKLGSLWFGFLHIHVNYVRLVSLHIVRVHFNATLSIFKFQLHLKCITQLHVRVNLPRRWAGWGGNQKKKGKKMKIASELTDRNFPTASFESLYPLAWPDLMRISIMSLRMRRIWGLIEQSQIVMENNTCRSDSKLADFE